MLRLIQRAWLALVLAGAVSSASAFSLLGPYDTWQTAALGYAITANADIGGPMNIHQEYRWDLRTVYYGFDSSFKAYFGQKGVDEVKKAIAILNNLPSASAMSSNLTEFPLDTRRANYYASALGLLDLKSATLGVLVEQMGLTSPERYAWTLRDASGTPIVYTVIKRNFDPVTLLPSSYVNGTLYTYVIFAGISAIGGGADAVPIPVDPLAFTYTAVASTMDGLWGGGISAGDFLTGLTRDDAGGLRFMYSGSGRYANYHIEGLVGTVTAAGIGQPWDPPGTNTNTIVTTALRPGVDKITFTEAKYDSVLGAFVTFTNTFTDYYVTNGTLQSQLVSRTISAPDILFTAADLGINGPGAPALFGRTDTTGWVNNATTNSASLTAGPGNIAPPITITYSELGPYQTVSGSTLTEANASVGLWWGSFDGTTNTPVVYPVGMSIQDLEQMVLGGN